MNYMNTSIRKYSRRNWLALTALAVVSILLGCSLETPSKQNTKVKIGYLPIAAGLPLFVAVERGFFAKSGFDVELVRFASSNDLGTAATAGQVQALMPFALNAGFDIGVVSGKRHQLFGYNLYSDKNPHIVDYLVVRKYSNIQTLADLKGRRVAGFPGSVTKVFVENILKKHGVEPKDYSYFELSPKDWLAALESGSVDAASVMEPQASLIISKGVGRVIVEGFFAKLMPDVPLSGHWLSSQFVEKEGVESAKRFVGAFDKAINFIRENPEQAKGYYVKYIGVEQQSLATIQLNDWKTLTEFDPAKVQAFADLLSDVKAIQQRVNVKQYILQTP